MELIILRVEETEGFEQDYRKYVKYISEERTLRIERIRSEKQKIVSLLTELLIRLNAMKTLGLKNDHITIRLGEHGKPCLEGNPHYHFSVSHAGSFIAFISDFCPVGVDIENSSRGNADIAKRFFTENEYKKIYCQSPAAYTFPEVWTRKEAYVKLVGTGLSHGLNTFDVTDNTEKCFFYTYAYDENYTVSVCTEREASCVKISELNEHMLLEELKKRYDFF